MKNGISIISNGSVPVESVEYLKIQFKKAGKQNLKVTIYPNANHRLDSKEKNNLQMKCKLLRF